MTTPNTHIRLDRIEDNSGNPTALLIPILGTTFAVTPDYKTQVTLANGKVFLVEEPFSSIESALSVQRVDCS